MDHIVIAVATWTAAINLAIAAADLVPAGFVLRNSAEVGVPRRWLPLLAACKAAGGAGILIGLAVARPLAIAASLGLVLFFVGAVIRHLQTRVRHNLAFPLVFLASSVATLALLVAG